MQTIYYEKRIHPTTLNDDTIASIIQQKLFDSNYNINEVQTHFFEDSGVLVACKVTAKNYTKPHYILIKNTP